MICQNKLQKRDSETCVVETNFRQQKLLRTLFAGAFYTNGSDPLLFCQKRSFLEGIETVIFYPNNYYPFEDSKKNASSFSCVIRASFFALNKAIFTRCGGELLKFYNTPLCWLLSPTLLLPQSRVPIWGLDKQFFLGWILTYFDSRASRWRLLAFF